MTRSKLYRLLLSGHGRAAKFILERGVDDYADIIVKAMLKGNPNGHQCYSRYWSRFVKAMSRPEEVVGPLYERLQCRRLSTDRWDILNTAAWFLDLGYEQFRPIVENPRNQRIVNFEERGPKHIDRVTSADEWIAHARAGRRMSLFALQNLAAEEKLTIIRAGLTEPDERTRGRMLWSFLALRAIPTDFRPLMDWVFSNDRRLSAKTVGLLKEVADPSIRDLALELAKGTDRQLELAADLMENNWQPGDGPVLKQWFARAKSLDVRHGLGLSADHIQSESGDAEWDWVLPAIYNEVECEFCRDMAVFRLMKQRRFSMEWAEEGLFDAVNDIVKASKTYLRRRKRDLTELLKLADV